MAQATQKMRDLLEQMYECFDRNHYGRIELCATDEELETLLAEVEELLYHDFDDDDEYAGE